MVFEAAPKQEKEEDPNVLTMVTRAQWRAEPPLHEKPLVEPVKWVGWPLYTVSNPCSDKEECVPMVQFLQDCHMKTKGFADIRPNFMIASNGTIYEGRGWLSNVGVLEPTDPGPYEGTYITIARIGMDFEDKPVTEEELAAKERIVKYGIDHNYIDPSYEESTIFQHLQF